VRVQAQVVERLVISDSGLAGFLDATCAIWGALSSDPVSSREAFVTGSYCFSTVMLHGVPPRRGIPISGYRLSDLVTFSGVRGGLRQRGVCQQENNSNCNQEPGHIAAPFLWGLDSLGA
jgi:hypothetical protein